MSDPRAAVVEAMAKAGCEGLHGGSFEIAGAQERRDWSEVADHMLSALPPLVQRLIDDPDRIAAAVDDALAFGYVDPISVPILRAWLTGETGGEPE